MAYVMNDDLVQEYVLNLCEGKPIVHHWGSTLRVSKQNELIYHRTGGYRRNAWGPVVLCEWQEKRNLFVLNGDGFNDNSATRYQNNLRVLVQGMIDAESNATPMNELPPRLRALRRQGANINANGRRYVLIPFLALGASQIDKQSILPIFVQADEFENVWHPMPEPPTLETMEVPEELPDGWTITVDNQNHRTFEVRHGGQRFRTVAIRRSRYKNKKTGRVKEYTSYGDTLEDWVYGPIWMLNGRWEVWGTPEIGQAGWQQLMTFRAFRVNPNRRIVGDQDNVSLAGTLADQSFGFHERVHHLGASIFSAANGDGRRKKYLSAFDEQETTQRMYYLAQLPKEASPTTYREAIEALAPPLVHEAWKKGTLVRRQGDIFAIETNLTDEQVYADAVTRVRREVALFNMDVAAVARAIANRQPLLEPAKGEVRERADCLCGCGHKRWIGCGQKAKQALSIYRTGHTATEVVVTKRGTFVRGTLYHDPHIEEPGRRTEHMTVPLGTENKWFLCCRNTVPRQKRRKPNTEGS